MAEEKAHQIARECLAVRARIASRDITRLYDDALRPLGLRITQLSVLVAISVMETALPSEIGEALHLDRSTLSRTLERMKTNGWIREIEGDDGRSRPVRLSPKGRSLINRAFPIWEQTQKHAQTVLAGKQLD